MVLFNYATKELTAKVVYYGPGLCGKTTNLQFIYDTLPAPAKGKMLSLATKTDRTLFFDFLPIDLGTIRGMKTKIQLYTVPGQVFYDTTRKLVLKGADGVVFVADSQSAMLDANKDSFENLITNLKEQNLDIRNMPHVIQFNKRDMKNVLPIDVLNKEINRHNTLHFEAVAPKGDGVFETLKGISKLVLKNLGQKYGLEEEKGSDSSAGKSPAKSKPAPKLPERPKRTPAAAKAPKPAPPKPTTEDRTTRPMPGGAPNPKPQPPSRKQNLKPIPSIDDSEVIELEDVEPLEIDDDLDDMAEIANMAEQSESKPAPAQAQAQVAPIEVPISINLPSSLEGKPLRLQIDIQFEQ